MKCPACGAEVVDGSRTCSACGKELSLGTRAAGETVHVAKETGVVAGKVGRGILGGAKGLASGAKKGFKGSPEEEKKEFVGKQLKVTATATNPVVSPGQRIVLAMDIELRPNAHVYAPGVESYIPIEWKMEDSNAALVQKAEFPAPQKLFLAAINETVPAYSGAFRVTRDITIEQPEKLRGAVDATGHFTLHSTLRYQACDDRICYIPQDLAVQWTFEYQELDAQRVPLELQHKAASASHP